MKHSINTVNADNRPPLLAFLEEEDYEDNDCQFAFALEAALGNFIRESPENAYTVWSALANVDWYREAEGSIKIDGRFSFRGAGGLLAAIRNDGTDYVDYYCSGPYATVSPFIAQTMKKHGWEYEINE